ncbi:hypothetical protein UlMin_008470 [Ulmus minor]
MATSMAALSRRLCRSLVVNPNPNHSLRLRQFCTPFSTGTTGLTSDEGSESAAEGSEALLSDSEPAAPQSSSSKESDQKGPFPHLTPGFDAGIYKAILVGRVGQKAVQKKLKNGITLTLFSIGTGGIRNNRRPLDNESPREYADRSNVQWHRVCVYPNMLGDVVMKNVEPGSILYVEGNLECKIFTDPTTGIVRRIREISIRRNGRIVFVGKEPDAEEPADAKVKGLGYY